MQPVHVPQPGVGQRGRPVQVHHQGAVLLGQLVHAGEQLLHARPEPLQHRALAAGAAHQHQLLAGRREPFHGLGEQAPDPAHVALGAQGVVQPADQRDDVGVHGRGHRHLLVDDLPDQLPAHGQVGVPEPGRAAGHPRGEHIGPAAVGAVGQQIRHALGEGVADRDEAGVRGRSGVRLHGDRDGIPRPIPAGRSARATRPAQPEDRPVVRTALSRPTGRVLGPVRCGCGPARLLTARPGATRKPPPRQAPAAAAGRSPLGRPASALRVSPAPAGRTVLGGRPPSSPGPPAGRRRRGRPPDGCGCRASR